MQYKKGSRVVRRWKLKRNALVGKLLEADKHLSRQDALAIANRTMRQEQRQRGKELRHSSYNLLARMPFGRWRDTPIKDVPVDYLRWFLREIKGNQHKSLKRSIRAFLDNAHLKKRVEPRQRPQVGPSSGPIAGEHYVPTGDTSCPF